jgi:hypothetical protein
MLARGSKRTALCKQSPSQHPRAIRADAAEEPDVGHEPASDDQQERPLAVRRRLLRHIGARAVASESLPRPVAYTCFRATPHLTAAPATHLSCAASSTHAPRWPGPALTSLHGAHGICEVCPASRSTQVSHARAGESRSPRPNGGLDGLPRTCGRRSRSAVVASRTRLPTESGDRLLPLGGVKAVDERARRQDLDIPDVRLEEIAIPRHERGRGR